MRSTGATRPTPSLGSFVDSWAEYHEARYLEQYLGAGLRRIRGAIVLRGDFPKVSSNEVQHFPACQAADLGGSGARRKGRVEAVDVEGEVGRAIANDLTGFGDDCRIPMPVISSA